jgi:hypothetical protein
MKLALPPIPILVLLILIAAWIAPLLIANIKRVDLARGPKAEPQLRRSFYWTLLMTAFWTMIYLIPGWRRDSSEHPLQLLMVVLGVGVTFWNFRRWRHHLKSLGQ